MIKEVRNQELIGFILSGELMKFYKSKEWMDLRLDALKEIIMNASLVRQLVVITWRRMFIILKR